MIIKMEDKNYLFLTEELQLIKCWRKEEDRKSPWNKCHGNNCGTQLWMLKCVVRILRRNRMLNIVPKVYLQKMFISKNHNFAIEKSSRHNFKQMNKVSITTIEKYCHHEPYDMILWEAQDIMFVKLLPKKFITSFS